MDDRAIQSGRHVTLNAVSFTLTGYHLGGGSFDPRAGSPVADATKSASLKRAVELVPTELRFSYALALVVRQQVEELKGE